jgi:hypothetical protein
MRLSPTWRFWHDALILSYCALSWWDQSGDARPGSNSTVFAPGLDWEPDVLLRRAAVILPWVFLRLPQELVLDEPRL